MEERDDGAHDHICSQVRGGRVLCVCVGHAGLHNGLGFLPEDAVFCVYDPFLCIGQDRCGWWRRGGRQPQRDPTAPQRDGHNEAGYERQGAINDARTEAWLPIEAADRAT